MFSKQQSFFDGSESIETFTFISSRSESITRIFRIETLSMYYPFVSICTVCSVYYSVYTHTHNMGLTKEHISILCKPGGKCWIVRHLRHFFAAELINNDFIGRHVICGKCLYCLTIQYWQPGLWEHAVTVCMNMFTTDLEPTIFLTHWFTTLCLFTWHDKATNRFPLQETIALFCDTWFK